MSNISRIPLMTAAAALLLVAAPAASFAQTSPTTPAQNSQTVSPQSATPTTTQPSAKPIEDLMAAAQQLRDATHNLVREPASPQRSQEIKQIDSTLRKVEDAIAALPPDLLLARANESESKKAAENLSRAADRLNDAVQALQKDAQAKKAHSLDDIRQALADIHRERLNVTMNQVGSNTGNQK